MSEAPSEKHLEDWICSNVNLCRYYTEFAADIDDDPYHYFIERVASRQAIFPSGRPDLIVIHHNEAFHTSLGVAELKKGTIDTKTLAQCLRYMRDLSIIFGDCRYSPTHNPHKFPYIRRDIECQMNGLQSEVSGLLIGHSLDDENIKVACEVTNISIYLYDYSEGDYQFTPLERGFDPSGYPRYEYEALSNSAIGWAAKDVIEELSRQDLPTIKQREDNHE